ncbi:MAG: A24 family peptidase [Phycisphaerae bacterium]|nr:A24 family peptidase [Phycisphaerae bacterium]
MVVATLWWILFFAAVGLAIGSYLNVVIYRLPRGISTISPRWSFCPRCDSRIRWYDNLPVLSYLWLGGRCRACSGRISARYPAVELLMGTLTLVAFDVFCVTGLRTGSPGTSMGLGDQLCCDWPIILAHVILFGCLLAMSAIDLEHYFIDIRFTGFAILAGVVLHVVWSQSSWSWVATVGSVWHRPGPTAGMVSLAVSLAALLTWLVIHLLAPPLDEEIPAGANPKAADSSDSGEPRRVGEASRSEAEPTAPVGGFHLAPRGSTHPTSDSGHSISVAAWLVALTFLIVMVSTAVDALSAESRLFPSWRLLVPIAICFVLIIGASVPKRDSDIEIVEAIEAERYSARKVALQELLLLAPAVVAGMVVAWFCFRSEPFESWCDAALGWQPWGTWRPIAGLATAAMGWVIGGGLGWAVRIGFTLLFGREAFGTGDIHLMAATGCVAGWPVVVMGFVLTSFLALAGWLVTLPFKQTRAIPLVPWLSLAFLIVIVFYSLLLEFGPVQNTVFLFKTLVSGKLPGMAY